MIDAVEQVIERHPEVKNEGISELKSLSDDKKRLLAALLRQDAPQAVAPSAPRLDKPASGSLVAIKASGSRPPFFCVHAVLGSVFPYYRLASYMEADQPFYALQSPGLDGTRPPLETIEEMAALYVDLVVGVQPRGPYYLGGYSFGGWVAFDMAQRLARAGEKVALLAIMGTSAPIYVTNPRLIEQISFAAQYADDYRRLVLNSCLSEAARAAGLDAAPQPGGTSPMERVATANNLAQFRYIPRPYGDRITVLMTGEQHAACYPDTSLGWKMLSVRDVSSHLVPGNHLSMLLDPHVQDLARALSACIARATGG